MITEAIKEMIRSQVATTDIWSLSLGVYSLPLGTDIYLLGSPEGLFARLDLSLNLI